MAKEHLPSAEYLRECFRYDAETGRITWKRRPRSHFKGDKNWQKFTTRLAGTDPCKLDKDGYRWGTAYLAGRTCTFREHRVVFKMLTGLEPLRVDHRDNVRDNNRFENLRAATVSQDNQNRRRRSGRSLPKGVDFHHGRFRASAWDGTRYVALGHHDTPEEAHAAYCDFARKAHGEFFNPG